MFQTRYDTHPFMCNIFEQLVSRRFAVHSFFLVISFSFFVSFLVNGFCFIIENIIYQMRWFMKILIKCYLSVFFYHKLRFECRFTLIYNVCVFCLFVFVWEYFSETILCIVAATQQNRVRNKKHISFWCFILYFSFVNNLQLWQIWWKCALFYVFPYWLIEATKRKKKQYQRHFIIGKNCQKGKIWRLNETEKLRKLRTWKKMSKEECLAKINEARQSATDQNSMFVLDDENNDRTVIFFYRHLELEL